MQNQRSFDSAFLDADKTFFFPARGPNTDGETTCTASSWLPLCWQATPQSGLTVCGAMVGAAGTAAPDGAGVTAVTVVTAGVAIAHAPAVTIV